jgi:DNA modification methylase
MIPERFALQCVQDGWIVRNKIIWHKPNAMPSSVKDRFSNCWEYLFLFSKSKKYYFDLDAVREPQLVAWERAKYGKYSTNVKSESNDFRVTSASSKKGNINQYLVEHGLHPNPLGKNPGDVIKVPYAVQPRLKEFVEFRNLPSLEDLKEYLNYWRKKVNLTIDEIEQKLNSQAPHHWFNGESYPSAEDWLRLKKLLNFDDKFDKAMTEIFIKPSEKQNHPLGKNPGDVIKLSPKYTGTEGHTNRQGLNRPLNIVTIKAYARYQKPIAEFLKKHIKSEHKLILDETFGRHKWPHWLRTDFSGAALPGVEDWKKLKEIINFPDDFDDKIYEVQKLNIPIFQSNHNPRDFWSITTQPFKEAHFAVFPEKLCERPILAGCPKSGIVLDPFCGSGTALVVAKRLGRNFIGIDIKPEYCEMTRKRLEKVPVRLDRISNII